VDAFRSILLPAPEAEALVGPFRRDGDWSHRHGIPAHLTLAGPFPPSTSLPQAELVELAAEIRGTRYELASAGMLGGALCLFPPDEGALIEWRNRALALIGEPDQVDSSWRLHLTVSRPDPASTLGDEVARTLGRSLPIACEVGEVLLAEMEVSGQVRASPLG
jgi:hypothetical protein